MLKHDTAEKAIFTIVEELQALALTLLSEMFKQVALLRRKKISASILRQKLGI